MIKFFYFISLFLIVLSIGGIIINELIEKNKIENLKMFEDAKPPYTPFNMPFSGILIISGIINLFFGILLNEQNKNLKIKKGEKK